MNRIRALSRGSKLTLAASLSLFASLFFTWQRLELDFGPAGTAVQLLDGWDAWGLLIGLCSLALAALVAVRELSDVELPEEVRWDLVALALGGLLFAATLVKNVTDRDSAIASYVGLALAALAALGAFLMWAEAASERLPRRRRRFRSAV
ncbi:MAG TPA: hypothetical protein VNJ46_09645 [Gaiellaceae bacterium]|nr:hypothetical protein [Gaiellaceae bacterium]